MSNRYQRGDFVPWAWQSLSTAQGSTIAAGTVSTTLQIKGHSVKLAALCIDVSNSGLGGMRGRIHGLEDIDGTVRLSLDKDVLAWLPALNVVHGQAGVCIFGLNAVTGIQCPIIIEDVHYESDVGKEVEWGVTVKGNSLSGVIVYPAVLT